MSSAILYVAIVAIWIGVLVPRWLRHEHARDGHLRLRRFSRRSARRPTTSAGAPPGVSSDLPHSSPPRYGSWHVPALVSGNIDDMAHPSETDAAPLQVRSYGWSAEEYLHQARKSRRDARSGTRAGGQPGSAPHGGRDGHRRDGHRRRDANAPRRPHDGEPATTHATSGRPGPRAPRPERRARMIRARRRMLGILTALTVAAAALTGVEPMAWWVPVAPVALLAGFLLLLREAARADGEARVRHARAIAAAQQPAAPSTHPADMTAAAPDWTAPEITPHAEVIDISARVGDQLYDQYADAKLRAVGN